MHDGCRQTIESRHNSHRPLNQSCGIGHWPIDIYIYIPLKAVSLVPPEGRHKLDQSVRHRAVVIGDKMRIIYESPEGKVVKEDEVWKIFIFINVLALC